MLRLVRSLGSPHRSPPDGNEILHVLLVELLGRPFEQQRGGLSKGLMAVSAAAAIADVVDIYDPVA